MTSEKQSLICHNCRHTPNRDCTDVFRCSPILGITMKLNNLFQNNFLHSALAFAFNLHNGNATIVGGNH